MLCVVLFIFVIMIAGLINSQSIIRLLTFVLLMCYVMVIIRDILLASAEFPSTASGEQTSWRIRGCSGPLVLVNKARGVSR